MICTKHHTVFSGGGLCPYCTTEVASAGSESPARNTQTAGDHYTKMPVQPWDVVDTWPLEQRIGFYRGNALKYIMRMGSKDENAQEIAKGKHYLEKLLEVLNATQPEDTAKAWTLRDCWK